jgi:hypothetical protein
MRFTKTFKAQHPRTVFRKDDVPTLRLWSNDANIWRTRWDNFWLPTAEALALKTAEEIAKDVYACDVKILTLATVGVIDNIATMRTKAIDAAVYYALNLVNDPAWNTNNATTRRVGAYAMAHAYDILYEAAEMTSTKRGQIRTGIRELGDVLQGTLVETDYIDGYSGGHSTALFYLGSAIQDEDSTGATYCNAALDFWWGATADLKARIYHDRYYCSDGGSGKGTSYFWDSASFSLKLLHAMHNTYIRNEETPGSFTLDGDDYAPWEDETWVAKIPEWTLHIMRGDLDILTIGDTARVTLPRFNEQGRWVVACLATRGASQFRGTMKWFYERMNGVDGSFTRTNSQAAFPQFFLMNPNDGYPSQTPTVAGVAKTRWFSPPNVYSAVLPIWEPRDACKILIHAEDRWYQGHTHLKCAGIQITVKDESVLLNSGWYISEEYATDHGNNWRQQSISCSGTPLVEGVSSNLSDEHYNWDSNGRVAYKNGLGGQCWMSSTGAISGQYGPDNTYDMVNAGSGLLWKKCDSSMLSMSDDMDVVWIDARRAYLKTSSHYGTTNERVKLCDLKYVVLKNVHNWPVILRVARVQSRLATMKKRDHWHFHSNPTWERVGSGTTDLRFKSFGYLNKGYCAIHYYPGRSVAYTIVGGGTQDSNGYGAFDFFWNGVNHKPLTGINSPRHAPDLGHYRVEVSPNTATIEDYFVSLIMPGYGSDVLPSYTWVEEPNYFGVQFAAGPLVRVHKTQNQVLYNEEADVEPPQTPTGPIASAGPGSGIVTVRCNPNIDDTVLYRWESREKP